MESEGPAVTVSDDVTSSSGCSSNENAIVLSLYLVQSEDDILHLSSKNNHTQKRANLYIRLCEACRIANKILRSAATQQLPFQSGGDGPIFGVHCDISNDELLRRNDFDADEYWQSQSPGKQYSKDNNEVNSDNDDYDDDGCSNVEEETALDGTDYDSAFQQPHLRAIFRYGNDVNDMWRCISLILTISTELANANLTCAVECWDNNDGHILLIEAAEHLPSWVDEDVLQGGVGGPEGTVNRCWIVDGQVHLIPPCASNNRHGMLKKKKVDLLSRRDALLTLLDSFNKDEDGSSTLASDAVQDAIQHRINRTDYSARKSNESSPSVTSTNQSSSHWHVAAAAVPASVAHFIEKHPSLIPLIIDSFCKNAQKYLKERKLERKRSRNKSANESTNERCQETAMADEHNMKRDSLGQLFPFEQIVAIPITMTRANFAELVTGRGINPSFPVPREYRSVELKRFHRQLGQTSSYGGLEDEKTNRNPFERAVDVGVRLCTGLEWIVHASEQKDSLPCPSVEDEDDELLLQTLGDIERRLRLYWTRIDAEASVGNLQHESEETETTHWIEQAWQAGPKDTNHSKCDKLFLSALESMSKCAVFHPELSKSLRDEPCPITRPNMSLRDIARSGIKNALKWQREHYNESHFPTPKLCQLDSDAWMEIESMEELEEEMKHLSSATSKQTDTKSDNKKPRRTTRRSRRNHPSLDNNNISEDGEREASSNKDALNQMVKGIRAFVEGEGDVEGISTIAPEEIEAAAESSIENLMSQEVKIRPHVFLGVLRNMLRDECNVPSQTGLDCNSNSNSNKSTSLPTPAPAESDISSFFFEEDLNYDSGDDSDEDTEEHIDQMQESHIDPNDDPFSLRNIMVSLSTCYLYEGIYNMNLTPFVFTSISKRMPWIMSSGLILCQIHRSRILALPQKILWTMKQWPTCFDLSKQVKALAQLGLCCVVWVFHYLELLNYYNNLHTCIWYFTIVCCSDLI